MTQNAAFARVEVTHDAHHGYDTDHIALVISEFSGLLMTSTDVERPLGDTCTPFPLFGKNTHTHTSH